MTDKNSVGLCKCGICFDYDVISEIPLIVKCKKCREEVIQSRTFVVGAK